jgi:hypothetical protein
VLRFRHKDGRRWVMVEDGRDELRRVL